MQQNLKSFLLPWGGICFTFVLILTLIRVLIYQLFAPLDEVQEFSSYLSKAFGMGLRMDLSVIAYANALPVILLFFLGFFPSSKLRLWKWWMSFTQKNFLILFLIILFAGIGEIVFYLFFNDRYNSLIFGFLYEDFFSILKTLFSSPYFWLGVISFLFVAFCIHFLIRFSWKKAKECPDIFISLPQWQRILCSALLLFTAFALARGNLHLYRPISVEDTDISPSLFMNNLSKTSVYAFIDAYKEYNTANAYTFDIAQKMGYENREKEAFADFSMRPQKDFQDQNTLDSLKKTLIQKTDFKAHLAHLTHSPHPSQSSPQPSPLKKRGTYPHVVIILMESLGSYWLSYKEPEFNLMGPLEEHFKEDYWFKNFFPSANGSFPSLAALIANLPDISGKPLPYFLDKNQVLPSAGARPFKAKGYKTSFIYGSSVSWKNFMGFARNQFFDVVEGANIIQHKLQKLGRKNIAVHDWGIVDEHFFDYLYHLLTHSQQPQLIVSGSSSNHPPFTFPKSYKPISLQWPQSLLERLSPAVNRSFARQRLQMFRYACDQLAYFLSRIKNSPLAKNTIVVVSADHNFRDLVSFSLQKEFIKQISVPLYLYIPPLYKPSFYSEKTFASHIDIFPTLYNLIFSRQEHISIGKDIFSKKVQPHTFALNSNVIADEKRAIVDGKYFFVWDNREHKYIHAHDETRRAFSLKLEQRRKALLTVVGEFIKNASQFERFDGSNGFDDFDEKHDDR